MVVVFGMDSYENDPREVFLIVLVVVVIEEEEGEHNFFSQSVFSVPHLIPPQVRPGLLWAGEGNENNTCQYDIPYLNRLGMVHLSIHWYLLTMSGRLIR